MANFTSTYDKLDWNLFLTNRFRDHIGHLIAASAHVN